MFRIDKLLISNRYIFSLSIVFIAALSWLLFNNFDIANYYKGYDPFRYLDHAIKGCDIDTAYACRHLIVKILGKLGDNTFTIYLNFIILLFFLLCISISKKVLPYLFISSPILFYFCGQPGKDVITIIASIALISLITDFELNFIKISSKKILIRKNFLINIFRVAIIIFAVFLRYKILLNLFILYFLNRNNNKNLKNNQKQSYLNFIFIIIIAIISIFILYRTGETELFAHQFSLDTSNFGNENFSFLIGTGWKKFSLRFFFYYFYIFLYPIKIIIDKILNSGIPGYITLLGICLSMQNLFIFQGRIFYKYIFYFAPFVLVGSIFIFPHLRYLIIWIPAVLTTVQLNQERIKPRL